MYAATSITGTEADGSPLVVQWRGLSDFSADGTPLYPEGLL
jgi:hypothetical protein